MTSNNAHKIKKTVDKKPVIEKSHIKAHETKKASNKKFIIRKTSKKAHNIEMADSKTPVVRIAYNRHLRYLNKKL